MDDEFDRGSAEDFSIFSIDATRAESRQVMGHGYDRATGDRHVYLWFGYPHFDLDAAHVTVFSASSGNEEASDALERAFEIYYYPSEEPPGSLPASESVNLTVDGKPVTFELWRNSSNRRWVARGCVESTEVILDGFEIEPSELNLVRLSDLTSFPSPFPFLGRLQ